MNIDAGCQICGSNGLTEVTEFSRLARVTSDAKPWAAGGRLAVCATCGSMQKLPDAAWLAEIAKIYGSFEIYHQSGGSEQFVYDPDGGGAEPRSVRLVKYLARTLPLPARGRLLDVGCGNGVTLASFAKYLPDWLLFGSELSDKSLARCRQIPGFTELYTCSADGIPGTYELISLVHSLEHMVAPTKVMSDLTSRLSDTGHIFVEVVDCARTPYDLLIADHLLHFTADTLDLAARVSGYDTVVLSNDVVQKELSWIGRPRASASRAANTALGRCDPERALATTKRHVAWLGEQIGRFAEVASHHAPIGIFGTAISATWLHSIISDKVAFFVDEDPGRINRKHMGLPIFAPNDVPSEAHILVPLISDIAEKVARRLARPNVHYHLPPALHDQTAAAPMVGRRA